MEDIINSYWLEEMEARKRDEKERLWDDIKRSIVLWKEALWLRGLVLMFTKRFNIKAVLEANSEKFIFLSSPTV